MREELLAARCVPRRGAEHRIGDGRLAQARATFVAWQVGDDEMVREVRFPDYYRTLAFVNALAFIAHEQDHHPDLSVHYDRVRIRYSTHDVGGLSENDLICAARVDRLLDGQ